MKVAVAALVAIALGALAPSDVEGLAPSQVEGQERITDIRVHGNHTTPDQDILNIAGLAVGETPTTERLAAAEAKLRDSHRFESVEVRKRYESISDLSQILIVLLVDEVPGAVSYTQSPSPRDGLLSRMPSSA